MKRILKTGSTLQRASLSISAVLVFPLLWWLVELEKIPVAVLWAFGGMSAITLILYGLDKLAAKRGAQRTPEKTLQLCALLCGWPGALLAQQIFRHKSSKSSFKAVFLVMVGLNIAAVTFLVIHPIGGPLSWH